MVDLTVGYVAGMVAAGFFLASQIAPNALAFILSWRLRDKSSAATWSVAASAFQQSHWSWFVFADNTYSNGVSNGVLWASRLIPLTGILLAIGSVVTPLGLYSAVVTGESVVGQFAYTFDTSAFGYGTPDRRNYTFSRTCGADSIFNGPKPCPFSDTISIMTSFPNGTISWDYPYSINVGIPDFIRKAYSSGTSNSSTISNYFDINWRRFSTTRSRLYMNGSSFFVGDYRNIQNTVLDNSYGAVEGLVVDAIDGGVGLRNHTAPVGFTHGVEWEEDLLFLEPESVCVDTNTTLDFTIKSENGSLIPSGNVLLTDRGGFVNLNQTYPRVNITDKQGDIELYMRAYKGAWLLNAYTALYFNVTNPANETAGTKAWSYLNSEMNKTFAINVAMGTTITNLESYGLATLSLSQKFGEYVKGALDPKDPTSKLNPWGVSSSNFSDISILCSGMGNGDYANITNMLIGCGQMRGVPQRVSPGHPSSWDDGSSWSQKIYVCATAVKANVKTASFSYNGTDGDLAALNVTGIRHKTYASDDELPLWGVENTGNVYNLTELQLIWGLVSDEYANHRNVSTVRARSLYIPGFMDPTNAILGGTFGDWENLPGSDFAIGAVAAAYSVSSTSTGLTATKGQDYTGVNNLAMWARWQNLTRDAGSAALIPNLIFTDTAASTIVGTKGALGPSNAGVAGNYPEILVTPSKQAVRFNLPYAVPAFLAAFLLLLILAVTLAAAIFGHNGYSRMRRHLQQTSSGRVYSTFLYPDPVVLRMSSQAWSEKFGDKTVDLSGDYPAAQDVLVPSTDEKDHGIVTSEQPIYQQQYQQQYDSSQIHHPGLEQQQTAPYYQSYQGYEGYHSGYTGMQSPSPMQPQGYEEHKNVTYHPGLPAHEQQVYQDIAQSPQSPQQHFPKAY